MASVGSDGLVKGRGSKEVGRRFGGEESERADALLRTSTEHTPTAPPRSGRQSWEPDQRTDMVLAFPIGEQSGNRAGVAA